LHESGAGLKRPKLQLNDETAVVQGRATTLDLREECARTWYVFTQPHAHLSNQRHRVGLADDRAAERVLLDERNQFRQHLGLGHFLAELNLRGGPYDLVLYAKRLGLPQRSENLRHDGVRTDGCRAAGHRRAVVQR
jgi:hypothetical protein